MKQYWHNSMASYWNSDQLQYCGYAIIVSNSISHWVLSLSSVASNNSVYIQPTALHCVGRTISTLLVIIIVDLLICCFCRFRNGKIRHSIGDTISTFGWAGVLLSREVQSPDCRQLALAPLCIMRINLLCKVRFPWELMQTRIYLL